MSSILAIAALACAIGPSEAAALPLPAFPGPPVTLRELHARSDLIVHAEVVSVHKEQSSWGSECWIPKSTATLKVLEVVEGDAGEAPPVVVFNPFLVCPGPPRYVEGETILAFLSNLDPDEYRVAIDEEDEEDEPCELPHHATHDSVALEDATKSLDRRQLDSYRLAIAELSVIEAEPDPERRHRMTTEWLVRAAEDPYLRHEALADFGNQSWRQQWGEAEEPFYAMMLSPTQLGRLVSVLEVCDPEDHATYQLISTLGRLQTPGLDAVLLAKLREIEGPPGMLADRIMLILARRLSGRELEAIRKRMDPLREMVSRAAIRREAVDEFITVAAAMIDG